MHTYCNYRSGERDRGGDLALSDFDECADQMYQLLIEMGSWVQGIRGPLPNITLLGSFISYNLGCCHLYGGRFNFYL